MHEEQSAHASVMVYTLMHNFVRQEHAPPGLLTQQEGGGLVLSIAGTPEELNKFVIENQSHASTNMITKNEAKVIQDEIKLRLCIAN